jgi:hypothetical protein
MLSVSAQTNEADDGYEYQSIGVTTENRSCMSLLLFIFSMAVLWSGVGLLYEGVTLAQKYNRLGNESLAYNNGIEFYFVVGIFSFYCFLQMMNLFRPYGIVLVEFLSILGFVCVFLSGMVTWFAIEASFKAEDCVETQAYCAGLKFMFWGSGLFLVGVLFLQSFHLYLLHTDKPLSPWTPLRQTPLESLTQTEIELKEVGSEITEEEAELRYKFWISTLLTFRFLHGIFLFIQVIAFIPLLIGIISKVRGQLTTTQDQADAFMMCGLVVLVIIGLVFSMLLMVDHKLRFLNYFILYIVNLINASGLGMLAFRYGACRAILSAEAESCQFDLLLFVSAVAMFFLLIIDEAVMLMSVGFGVAEARGKSLLSQPKVFGGTYDAGNEAVNDINIDMETDNDDEEEVVISDTMNDFLQEIRTDL